VLGRERVFEYASSEWGTRVAQIRLNYAVEMRYGVPVDIARKVFEGREVDLAMGHVNVIWQGDANSVALRLLEHCASPPFVLNLTGQETLSVRALAEEFGRRFGRAPKFVGVEAETALLSNASRCAELFGPPRVTTGEMIGWIAEWVQSGGASLGKPTHFEMREGKF
jgi:nucleoside-diphosphate-sugar epimerase